MKRTSGGGPVGSKDPSSMLSDHLTELILLYLDSESQFHYLNYYYQQELNKTNHDEELCYKLECLYEWWEQEERELVYLKKVNEIQSYLNY